MESAGNSPRSASTAGAAGDRAPPRSLWRREEQRPRLLSTRMLLLVWLPIVVISVLHYGTDAQHLWVHDVLRRLYYLPIIFAAFLAGLRGGLIAAGLVSLSYLPHAFLHLGPMAYMDPADSLEKALEVVLYNLVAVVAGYLADSEWKRRAALERALEEQRRLQRQLVRAGRLGALGEVVAGIAHEIKNPLHSLRGTAEIVDPLIPADAEQRRLWEIHVSELARLERVAERFLSFARPHPISAGPLDLCDVARRLVELIGTDARKKDVEIEQQLPDEPVMVEGDRDQLAQVALNIALNAVNAIGDRGGRLRVSVVPDLEHDGRAMHTLCIENDGPPIPEDEIEHLFDPFHGSDDQGSGLGLSISERIVEQHDGTLHAENGGLGVVFKVCLPAA